jgi:hypothetical protein
VREPLVEMAINANRLNREFTARISSRASRSSNSVSLSSAPEHAWQLFGLPLHHRDLVDRPTLLAPL